MTSSRPALWQALAYLAAAAVKSPSAATGALRAAGRAVLDYRFERTRPFPPLASEIGPAGSAPLLLPSPRLLGRGNQSLDGLAFLVDLARSIDASIVLEIGTYNGLTAQCLAANLPDAHVVTLDLPGCCSSLLERAPDDRLHVGAQVIPLGWGGNVEYLHGDSAEYDFSRYYGNCDLVYVDGAHSCEYVLRDTATALRLVSPRGAIVWDDYTRGMSDVVQALDSLAPRVRAHRVGGTRLLVAMPTAIGSAA